MNRILLVGEIWKIKNGIKIFLTLVLRLLPPPEHGAETHDQMAFAEIIKEVKKNNTHTYGAKDEKETLVLLKKMTKKEAIKYKCPSISKSCKYLW